MKKFLSWKPFRKLSLILQIAEEQKDRNVTGNTEIYLTFLQLIRAIPTKNAGLSNLISELTQALCDKCDNDYFGKSFTFL